MASSPAPHLAMWASAGMGGGERQNQSSLQDAIASHPDRRTSCRGWGQNGKLHACSRSSTLEEGEFPLERVKKDLYIPPEIQKRKRLVKHRNIGNHPSEIVVETRGNTRLLPVMWKFPSEGVSKSLSPQTVKLCGTAKNNMLIPAP